MKLKKTNIKAKSSASKKDTAPKGNVITIDNFDSGLSYVGKKVPTATIRKEAVGREIEKLTKAGFLVIHGNKPGELIHPVKHDGDIYSRETDDGTVFGSVEAINSIKHKGFKAELLDLDGLKALAKKTGKAAEMTHRANKRTYEVAFISDPGASYMAALAVDPKSHKVRVLNMEPPRSYNKKHVQFDHGKDLDAKKVLAVIAKAH